ncbi:MAG: hypothetical protein ACK4PR_09915, partial [Gammaproteobacteria bacterium]
MIFILSLSIVFVAFLYGWRLDARFKMILSPFMIFSVYFLTRVIPGFYVGINEHYDVSSLYVAILPIAYLAFFFAYFSGGARPLDAPQKILPLVRGEPSWQLERPVWFFLVVTIVAGLALYKGMPPAIGVAVNVASNAIDAKEAAGIVSEARREISKGHVFNEESEGSGIFREIIFTSALLMLATASVYFFAKFSGRSIFLLIASLMTAYVFVSGDGTRGRFVVIFTAILIAFTLFKNVRPVHAVLGAGMIFLVSIALGAYTNKMASLFEAGQWGEILRTVSERI